MNTGNVSRVVARSIFFVALLAVSMPLGAQQDQKVEPAFPDSWSEQVNWRSIGPANMSGRITAIAVYEKDSSIWWAASASGGLVKTNNNGITFEHQFDDQATVSIGDVQVSKTDPDLLWVGTGESNPRNSVSWGDGVYKSTDGGKTWTNMGLKETFQTGRIAIHPENHDIVYVGSLGRLWGPSPERGLFKTTDGGKTWKKILFVDDKTGIVDVQMNPKNPDELLVATYERMRDGTDDNDPIKKYGDGSAIYKTTDGGETFRRLSQGLPSCKLGRIGLSYFARNPNYVCAIVETEKIANQPETAAFAGLRGENAEVGAKITQVTDDGPADKAGLKENDIVVSVDGRIVYSYNDLTAEIRKHQAGETVKLIVSRDRKPVDLVMELGKLPQRKDRDGKPRSGPTPFDGTLGGQAENLQGQQGDNEHEYGGVYLSKDGGDSWERINTLNPRPMYYSQIRFDPGDRKNMYVLGTSLYRSSDGGETFTSDGGNGIHPDHHALWIDPDDSRRMILGNDGGIYLTFDRMDHWDHLNHVAIGQFYHAGVDSRMNYRVYGGLQDNGSWGGPSRVANDSGSVNTDWVNVGGGDGFVTIPDPDDPDQIYFESQNGGMGRINLRTGDRGFIRPRPPRGTRYRFNWKTPFILSPHNSQIHFSAGNHVFRSFNKGAGIESISPEISNTDQGSGSAISESPVKAGVLYVGTTDGAVWMTKNGGQEWIALYSSPQQKNEADEEQQESKSDEAKPDEAKSQQAAESKEDAGVGPAETTEAKKPMLNGIWNGKMISDRFPEGQAPTITFSLKADEQGKVSGDIETRRGTQEISSGEFDPETGELSILIETDRGEREYSATVKGKKMSGEMIMRDGQFTIEFEAEKQDDPGKPGPKGGTGISSVLSVSAASIVFWPGVVDDDPISGNWNGIVRSEQLPDGEITFTIELKLRDGKLLIGRIESPRGEFDITEGNFNTETKKLYFYSENEDFVLDFEAVLSGDQMTGDVSVNDTLTADFTATRVTPLVTEPEEMTLEVEQKDESSAAETAKPKLDAAQDNEGQAAQEEQSPAARPDTNAGRGFLGVMLGEGLEIVSTVEDSPAALAGMQAGDVLKSIDGTELQSRDQLMRQLGAKKSGDSVEVAITRGEEEIVLTVKLAAAPQAANSRRQGQRPPMDEQIESADTGGSNVDRTADDTVKDADPVTGTWKGVIESPQGESELTLVLKRSGDSAISGTYETTRSDGEITEGTFAADSGELSLVADNGQFTLEFNGKLEGENYVGEIDFNGGTFSMAFNAKRMTKSAGAPTDDSKNAKSQKSTGKTLAELMPGPRWVSSLQASKYKVERCYISFDGHRNDDLMPHVFVSEDYGATWNSIRGNLPDSAGSVRVVREDIRNENVLYLGCEFGGWVSIDRGQTWTRFAKLPTVAVHEFAQHPTVDEIVAATHGRSLWVGDVSLIRQTKPDSRVANRVLYKPRDVVNWRSNARRGSSGTRQFVARNPPNTAGISWSLGQNARSLELTIHDLKGAVVKRFDDLPTSKGLHGVEWDLRIAGSGQARQRFGPRVATGNYLVNLRIDGELLQTTLEVLADPERPVDAVTEDAELQWWLELGRENELP